MADVVCGRLGSEFEDDDLSIKPAAKKPKQSKVEDFFSAPAPSKPAAKSKTAAMKAAPKAPAAKKAPPKKKKAASSDDEDADVTIDASPVAAAPKRPARATSKPSKYIDISDDDGDNGGAEEDVYEQDDDSD